VVAHDSTRVAYVASLATPLSTMFGSALQAVAAQDTAGIDAKVIAAWEKAGATFGWLWYADAGLPQFTAERPKGMTAMPGFDVRSMRWQLAGPLPIPAVPFALYVAGRSGGPGFVPRLPGLSQASALILDGATFSLADLKELAGLKHLRLLGIA